MRVSCIAITARQTRTRGKDSDSTQTATRVWSGSAVPLQSISRYLTTRLVSRHLAFSRKLRDSNQTRRGRIAETAFRHYSPFVLLCQPTVFSASNRHPASANTTGFASQLAQPRHRSRPRSGQDHPSPANPPGPGRSARPRASPRGRPHGRRAASPSKWAKRWEARSAIRSALKKPAGPAHPPPLPYRRRTHPPHDLRPRTTRS